MTSDSEHTLKQRSPQQAQGRNWPILVLLLGLAALTLALTACGGSSSTSTPGATSATTPAPTATAPPTPSSTSTPGATTGSPPTATLTPASTPTPEPTEAVEVGESAGTIRYIREYRAAYCSSLGAVEQQEPATWGEAADLAQKAIDLIEKNEPPEELREFFEASVAMNRLLVRFAKERRSLSFEDDETRYEFFNEDPERDEAFKTLYRAQEALDDAVQEVFESNC